MPSANRIHRHPMNGAIVTAAALTFGLGLVPAAQAAGQVELSFSQPERFTDAGVDPTERRRNLDVLSKHMQGWSAQLPAGSQLRLAIDDIDLAGEQRLDLRHPDLRILRGNADWPRMTLRWSLTQGERTLKGGESHLSDMGYLMFGARLRQGEPLNYERRMLDDWLQREVLPAVVR